MWAFLLRCAKHRLVVIRLYMCSVCRPNDRCRSFDLALSIQRGVKDRPKPSLPGTGCSNRRGEPHYGGIPCPATKLTRIARTIRCWHRAVDRVRFDRHPAADRSVPPHSTGSGCESGWNARIPDARSFIIRGGDDTCAVGRVGGGKDKTPMTGEHRELGSRAPIPDPGGLVKGRGDDAPRQVRSAYTLSEPPLIHCAQALGDLPWSPVQRMRWTRVRPSNACVRPMDFYGPIGTTSPVLSFEAFWYLSVSNTRSSQKIMTPKTNPSGDFQCPRLSAFFDSREKINSAARVSRDKESSGPDVSSRRNIIRAIAPRHPVGKPKSQ
jgi:hypothetical protein